MKTKFDEIQFNKEFHTYRLAGRQLTNVTKLVSSVKLPFDRDGMAAKLAAREGVPVAEILARWEKTAEEGRAKGSRVHSHIEEVLRGIAPADDPFLAFNERLPEMAAFEALWGPAGLSATVKPLEIEWVIGDAALGIAGTADALLWSSETGTNHLWDWKTGKEFNTSTRWGKYLLAPFDDLEECELNQYSIQLSIYRLIIERNTDLNLGDSYLVHLAPDGSYQVFRAVDLRERCAAWLAALKSA